MTATAQSRVLFLFEAAPVIGWGHASRCLALADAMSPGATIGLAVNHAALAMLGPRGSDVVAVFEDGRPESVIEALCGEGVAVPDTVVIDHYRIERAPESRLRSRGARVVVIDDLADRHHDCDVLIDSNPARNPEHYRPLVPADCRLLLGADYALLRAEFRKARLASSEWRRPEGARRRVMISLGATDPANATSKVLAALSGVKAPIDVTIVLGQGALHAGKIAEGLPALTFPARLVTGAGDMAALYAAHDLAIGAPATSALERACVGLPSLIIETADNQRELAKALQSASACLNLGPIDEVEASDIAAAVDRELSDPSSSSRMRAAGRALVDGNGARRVAANLCQGFATRDGKPLVGRRLRSEDAASILAWQSAPGVRRYSRNPEPPSEQEHSRWIQSRLAVTNVVTEVIIYSGRPVALARLDPRDGCQEVSILVSPQEQARGVGEASVRYLESFRDGLATVAVVHPENAASIRLFRKCGYGAGPQMRLELMRVDAPEGARH